MLYYVISYEYKIISNIIKIAYMLYIVIQKMTFIEYFNNKLIYR